MTISFEWVGVLEQPGVQGLAKNLLRDNIKLVILTQLSPDDAQMPQLQATAKALGIEEIRYTGAEPKWKCLQGIDVHYDRDTKALAQITRHKVCLAFYIGEKDV